MPDIDPKSRDSHIAPAAALDATGVSDSYLRGVRRRLLLEATSKSIGVGGLAGAIAGFIWGGVGGRVAMRIVFLTSDDRVRGLTSDDGFEIGTISAATVFLLIATAILGTVVGLAYGFLRMFLAGPKWIVAIAMGVAAGAVGGAMIVHSDGIDFHILGPLWLTVGLFVLIPAAWGVTVVLLTDRLLRSGVLPKVPALVHQTIGGAIVATAVWLLLALVTVLGLAKLAGDISRLT